MLQQVACRFRKQIHCFRQRRAPLQANYITTEPPVDHMNRLGKHLALCLVIILAVSSMLMVIPTYAQTITNSQVPQFSLRYVDKSYDVAPTTTSSTDPYTGNITITTIPGRHVSDPTIEVTIKNGLGASYFGLRYKGHYSDSWTYFPYSPDSHNIYDGFFPPHFQASSSSYTVDYLYLDLLPQPIPQGAPIDVQVQPLFGNFDVTPYGHAFDVGGPTYDAVFKGTVGDWSDTQTINLPSTSVAPTPTVPEVPYCALLFALFFGAASLIAVIFKHNSRYNARTA
jgi:hypothetical protein